MPEAPFVYDLVRYESAPVEQAHPDRSAVLALLHGMSPAPVERCRMLELGCGIGAHLLPLALTLPGSRFLGIDLSRSAVEAARSRAAALGARNLDFERRDILEVGPEIGEFDYIVAHGVYSWVPGPIRDKVLAIARASLAPQGVAYISYNAFPGCHTRLMLREMMLWQTAGITDPELKLKHAYALLNLLCDSPKQELAKEAADARARSPYLLFHDDLSEDFFPVYFEQFIQHAAAHGLQFLADADFPSMQLSSQTAEAAGAIRTAAGGNPIREQQYLDFLECRRFHGTLLCRTEVPLRRTPADGPVRAMYVATSAEQTAEGEFCGPRGARMQTNLEYAIAALRYLAERRPAAVPYQELLAAVGKPDPVLAALLLKLFSAGLVSLHTIPSKFTIEPGECPQAFALARLQAACDGFVTNLRHRPIELADEKSRRAVTLMDGTRDHHALARDLDVPRPEVDQAVASLARLALLES